MIENRDSNVSVISRVRAIAIPCLLGISLGGCNRDQPLGGKVHDPLETGVVVDQGVTAGENGDLRDVVYLLLRAIRDDVKAGDDVEARQAAFDRQLALCAPDHIYARALKQSLGREEAVREIVWNWAPTFAHYVDGFPTNLESAKSKMVLGTIAVAGNKPEAPTLRSVSIELPDPSGHANASVVAGFELVKENGFWRVLHVGFDEAKRTLHLIESHG